MRSIPADLAKKKSEQDALDALQKTIPALAESALSKDDGLTKTADPEHDLSAQQPDSKHETLKESAHSEAKIKEALKSPADSESEQKKVLKESASDEKKEEAKKHEATKKDAIKESLAAEAKKQAALKQPLTTESQRNAVLQRTPLPVVVQNIILPDAHTVEPAKNAFLPKIAALKSQKAPPPKATAKASKRKISIPHEPDKNVIKEFWLVQDHPGHIAADKALEQQIKDAEKKFHELNHYNRKDAERKKHNNAEVNAVIDLACLINSIHLVQYFEKQIEKMIEKTQQHEIKVKAAEQRRAESIEALRHVNLLPPVEKRSALDAHKATILQEAHLALESIHTQREEIKSRMMDENEWGADTWEAGLEIQINKFQEVLEAKRATFSTDAIIKSDRVLNEEEQKQLKIEEVKLEALLKKADKEFAEFLKEQPPPTPMPDNTGGIILGSAAPSAPPMANRSIIIGDQAPIAPAAPEEKEYSHLGLDPVKLAKKAVKWTDLGFKAEIFRVNQLLKVGAQIGEPLIEEIPKLINENNSTIDVNSDLRIAVRGTTTIADEIKAFAEKRINFVNDDSELKNLDKLKAVIEEKIATLDNTKKLTQYQSPRPNPFNN
jgi:hypothetical protein